jgi:hypothetical protein
MTSKAKLSSGQTVTWNEQDQVVYYSNLMGISMTPFDIGILFGQIGKATETDIEGLVLAKILMSPEQVQNLIKLLALSLEKYVEGNGQLRNGGALDESIFIKALEENKVVRAEEAEK